MHYPGIFYIGRGIKVTFLRLKNYRILFLIFVCNIQFGYANDSTNYTLDHFVILGKKLIEFPPCDNLNWIDPDYSNYLKSIKKHYLQSLCYNYGIFDKTASLEHVFLDLLSSFKSVEPKHENCSVLCLEPGSSLYVWGDLHGSFHTLLKSLLYLKKQNVINDELQIRNSEAHFIIFGDAVSRGSCSMATLALIIALLKKNPTQVHYIKGNHESFKYWENFALKREIQILINASMDEHQKVKELVNNFFNTLPDYLLVYLAKEPDRSLLFAFNGIVDPYIHFNQPLSMMIGLHDRALVFDQYDYTGQLHIPEVIFKTEDWKEGHCAINGLGMLSQIFGATTWAVFSAPIQVHQAYYNFVYHAFAKISLNTSLRNSTVACINQHKDKNDFVQQEELNLVTGRSVLAGGHEAVGNDILLGSTMPLIEGLPVVSHRTKQGISIAVNEKNMKGGIAGRHIKFDVRNDNYVPFIARGNIEDLRRRGVEFIFAPVGSATLNAYVDLVVKKDIAVIFPITGNPFFSSSELQNIVNLTAMYTQEIGALIRFLLKNQSVKNFAFIYQEDEYSKETLDKAHEVLVTAGISDYTVIPYVRGAIDLKNQIEKLNSSNIDALGFLCTPQVAQEFIRKVGVESLKNKVLFGLSTLTSSAFKQFLKQKGLVLFFTSRVPNVFSSGWAIAAEYRALMERFSYPLDTTSLEGYLGARLFFNVLEKNNTSVNSNNLLDLFQKMQNVDFGAMNISFDRAENSFNLPLWIGATNQNQWIEISNQKRS